MKMFENDSDIIFMLKMLQNIDCHGIRVNHLITQPGYKVCSVDDCSAGVNLVRMRNSRSEKIVKSHGSLVDGKQKLRE